MEINMTKIKLTDNLSLSQIIRGFWRLDTWELSTDELIDNMKSSIDLGEHLLIQQRFMQILYVNLR